MGSRVPHAQRPARANTARRAAERGRHAAGAQHAPGRHAGPAGQGTHWGGAGQHDPAYDKSFCVIHNTITHL